jgi:hypothetical protein
MDSLLFVLVVSFAATAWSVAVCVRSKQWLEALGNAAVWTLAAASMLRARDTLQEVMVGGAFLIALPLMWVNLKRSLRPFSGR